MKLLITGASGQLGCELQEILKSGTSEIGPIPSEYKDATLVCADLPEYDLTDAEVVEKLIDKVSPNIVINCAAYTNVDGCEQNRETAKEANATLPKNLAIACEKQSCTLVHISTDYVFSGTEEVPRVESDECGPVSAYGETKLAGEIAVQENVSHYHIVRTSWLFGKHGKNFVETMLSLAETRDEITVVNDQFGNPTSANDLAHELLRIALSDDYGIWHATGEGICSWADFADRAIKLAGKSCNVRGITSEEYAKMAPAAANRPKYSALENKHLKDTIGNEMRDWKDALEDYIKNRESK